MKKLTAAENRVYEYIERFLTERGYAPSVRDICEELGYKSTSTVHLYLGRLEQMGYIEREDGKLVLKHGKVHSLIMKKPLSSIVV